MGVVGLEVSVVQDCGGEAKQSNFCSYGSALQALRGGETGSQNGTRE